MDHITNHLQMIHSIRQKQNSTTPNKSTNIKGSKEEKNKELARLRKSSQDFESIFINEMFKAMRKSNEINGGLIEKDNATKMFEEMRDTELANLAAKSNNGKGTGLGEAIFNQMSPLIITQIGHDKD